MSTLFAILSKQYYQGLHCLPFSAVCQCIHYLPFFLSIITKDYTVCRSQQTDQGLHYLSFSAVWSGSTLFAILNLIRFYTICLSQQSDQGLDYLPFFLCIIIKVYIVCHSQQSDWGLLYLPFSVWSWSYWNSQQSNQCLHCLPFSAVWLGSTLFAILSLIMVYSICILRSLIRIYTICHSF